MVEKSEQLMVKLPEKVSLKSSKCHKFKSRGQSKLRRAMDNLERLQKDFERKMERAQKEFAEAYQNVISNADLIIKR